MFELLGEFAPEKLVAAPSLQSYAAHLFYSLGPVRLLVLSVIIVVMYQYLFALVLSVIIVVMYQYLFTLVLSVIIVGYVSILVYYC